MDICSEATWQYPCNYDPFPVTEEFKGKIAKYSIVQCLDYYEFGANACRAGHKNVFCYCNENVVANPLYKGHLLDNKQIIQEKARHFVAVSESVRQCLLEEGVSYDRISVIPFWVTPKLFGKLELSKGEVLHRFNRRGLGLRLSFGGDFIVLYVGRKSPSKGLYELFKAVQSGSIPYTPLEQNKMTMICVGPDEGVKIPDWVINLEKLEPKQLLLMYNIADVLVLPSLPQPCWVEQFGRVIAEAAACGCPAISTDLGGPRDLIDNWKTGFLVPPGDVGALREAIELLIENPEMKKRFGMAAREKFEREFDPDDVSRRLRECFEKHRI